MIWEIRIWVVVVYFTLILVFLFFYYVFLYFFLLVRFNTKGWWTVNGYYYWTHEFVYNCQAGLGGLFKVIDDGKIGYECEKTNELLTKQIVFVAHNNWIDDNIK